MAHDARDAVEARSVHVSVVAPQVAARLHHLGVGLLRLLFALVGGPGARESHVRRVLLHSGAEGGVQHAVAVARAHVAGQQRARGRYRVLYPAFGL